MQQPPSHTPPIYPYQNQYPYPYSIQVAPPLEKNYPVPAGLFAPYLWGGILIALTITAIMFSLVATSTSTHVSLPNGSNAYNSALLQDDNQWTSAQNMCNFTSAGLDVIQNQQTFTSSSAMGCSLQNLSVGDLAMQVTIKDQNQLANELNSAIFVHSNLRFLFFASGEFTIDQPSVSGHWSHITTGFSNEWHGIGALDNTVTIIVQGTHIQLGINGIKVADATSSNSDTGSISLSSFYTQTSPIGEALYTNLRIVQL